MTVKIRFQLQIVLFALISFSTPGILHAQDSLYNKYGLWVIKDLKVLKATIKKDSNKLMADIKKFVPGIVLDLRYAGVNNFLHKKLYPKINTTYARIGVAKALQVVQIELNQLGFGLKIFDAYRPYSITEKIWEQVKDDRYAADPKNGSGHNRGIAVDVTLVNASNGTSVNTGTEFDNFSDTTHHSFKKLPEEIIKNRNILKRVMEQNGFIALETEWWHYSLPNAKNYELLDMNFKGLKKLK